MTIQAMTQMEGVIPTQNPNQEGNREENLEGKNQRKNAGDPVHHQALLPVHPEEEADLGAEGQKDPDLKAPDEEGRPKRRVEEESRAPRAENLTRLVKEAPGLEPVQAGNRRLPSTR